MYFYTVEISPRKPKPTEGKKGICY